jgi:hypothetical protein
MGLEAFKNKFDLDGRLKVHPLVTPTKVLEAKRLLEAARRSRVEEARVAELLTTSDLAFSIAHLANIEMIPQLPEELKDIDGLAGVRSVKDFNPVVLRGLWANAGVEGAGVDEHGAAAIVPEGAPYPHVTVSSDEEAYYSKLDKRGFRADVTFEAIINDVLGEIESLPGAFGQTVVDTHYAEIFDALESTQTVLGAATLLDGTSIPVNAPVGALSIIAAVEQIENSTVNGRKVGSISGYNVIVAPGRKRFLEYDIAQLGRVISVQDGALTLGPDAELQALFPNVTIIESDRVTGTAWYIYPKPGTTRRPVLERLTLRGYEQAEIRVRSDQGYFPGGGKVGIWEGGFDNDTASFRLRMFTGAVLWDDTYVVKSDGDGQA